ncbi:hypothetical protein [Lampropedia aestuarii]|uniref:hypothetical protein n=1 Tax=Lampropedia aestuarii TaxID=2562762 RepID=UPI00246996F0|nr:hypothetical protein [Lampropedia aestuarii]MDH5857183.1 hypothetical protein [Lampropedia aestuarii]
MRSAFITGVLALGLGWLAGLWWANQSKARLQLHYELQITQMQAEQDRLRVAAVLAQAAALQANTDQANLAALLAAQAGEQIHVQYRTIAQVVEKIIERPVYRSQCLDADGLRQLNDFIRGATDELDRAGATGQPGTAMR